MDLQKVLDWLKTLPNWGKVLAIIIIVLMLILQLWSCKTTAVIKQSMYGPDTIKMETRLQLTGKPLR